MKIVFPARQRTTFVVVVIGVLQTLFMVLLTMNWASVGRCPPCSNTMDPELEELANIVNVARQLVKTNSPVRLKLDQAAYMIRRHLGKDMPSSLELSQEKEEEEGVEGRSATKTGNSTQGAASHNVNEEVDICPVEYRGKTQHSGRTGGSDHPVDEHGWTFTKCDNAKPLESIVTVLVSGVGKSRDQLLSLLKQIRREYPRLQINVACTSNDNQIEAVNKVRWIQVQNPNSAWEDLIRSSGTKYSVVLRDVHRFTNYTILERLVSVAVVNRVSVVGGAAVGANGHWWNNCYQIKMKLFKLKYLHGYYLSKDSCMFCDHIAGPFLARSDVLQTALASLSAKSSTTVFEELFLKLRKKEISSMVCPDVMFHVDEISLERDDSRERWLSLARQEQLETITIYSMQTFQFGCNELGIRCPVRVKGMANPPCCNRLLSKCLQKTSQLAYDNDFMLEIRCGSLLGAIKLNTILPWELDGDMHFLDANFTQIPRLAKLVEPHGCRVSNPSEIKMESGKMDASGWPADFTRFLVVPSLLYRQRTGYNYTFVLLDGEWVRTPPSPGLAMYNKYRTEIYQHVPHLMHGGNFDSTTGFFPPCPKPGHHNCLDQFKADGSIQFTED